MGRFDNLRRIEAMDPQRDYAEIVRIMVFHEFPWDFRAAGKLMIWHLYAVPSTAAVMGTTDALVDRPVDRAETTALAMGDLIEHGFDSPAGRATLRLVNRGHRGWRIPAEDHRYALAALAVTAVRWLDRHGWRPLSARERTAVAVFYAELGRRVGAPGLPRRYDELAGYFARRERERIAYSPAGEVASTRTLAMARGRLPWPLAALVGSFIGALLPGYVRAAVGMRRAPLPVRLAVRVLLAVRPRVVRLLPPRRTPTTPRTRRGEPATAPPVGVGRG